MEGRKEQPRIICKTAVVITAATVLLLAGIVHGQEKQEDEIECNTIVNVGEVIGKAEAWTKAKLSPSVPDFGFWDASARCTKIGMKLYLGFTLHNGDIHQTTYCYVLVAVKPPHLGCVIWNK